MCPHRAAGPFLDHTVDTWEAGIPCLDGHKPICRAFTSSFPVSVSPGTHAAVGVGTSIPEGWPGGSYLLFGGPGNGI